MTKEELEEGVVYYTTNLNNGEWLIKYNHKGFVGLKAKGISTGYFNHYEEYIYTKATPSQIKHYEACMKAGKYVEVLEVGKWYQWYQSDHGNTHIGKCLTINKDNVSMSPWIIGRTTYGEEGSFHPRCIEEIIELPESEVQQYLPKEAEEWGEGTYVVIIDNYHSVDIGDVHKIGFNIFKDCIDIEESVGKTCFPNKDCCKWFATKQEAEEFAKTLKEPIKYLDDKNRPLKEFKIGSWYSNPKLHWIGLTNGNQAKFFRVSKCDIESNSNNQHYYNRIWFDAHADSDWNIEDIVRTQASAYHDQDMAEVFPVVKSERYIKTMEFFNQLREPEKSQAIANYNEGFDKQVPSKLREAVGYGFNWADSPERYIYWENICSNIRNNTCFNTKEAVHCPTQEEFDYVTEKLGYKWSLTYPFHKYTTDSCIEIGLHCYRRKSDFEGYIILSFQEWCTKYNHEGLKPWVAKVGDWVMIHEKELPIHSNWLGEGGRISHQGPYKVTSIGTFNVFNVVTKLDDISTSLGQSRFRKATQAEIDSVNKGSDYDIDKPQWTYNNWYVEVSSQEEADMVIEAAAKMYSKPINKVRKFVSDWKYVSFDFEGGDFSVFTLKHLPKLPKPRPISDFITINDSSIFPIETMKAHLRRLDKPYQQYPLTPSESFKVKSNPKLLDNNVSKISSINISLKQKSKTKKL